MWKVMVEYNFKFFVGKCGYSYSIKFKNTNDLRGKYYFSPRWAVYKGGFYKMRYVTPIQFLIS